MRSAYGGADTRAAYFPMLIPSFHSWVTKLDTHRPALEVQGSTSEPAVRRVFARERSGPSAVAVRRAGTDRFGRQSVSDLLGIVAKRLTPGCPPAHLASPPSPWAEQRCFAHVRARNFEPADHAADGPA